MDTIQIVSTDPRTQGPFVVINNSDFNPDVHELYGDQDMGAPAERVPTMAELLVARDQLLERERFVAVDALLAPYFGSAGGGNSIKVTRA